MFELPLVSVITPIFQVNQEYLLAAYQSLQAQTIEWEWLLQWDGEKSVLPDQIAKDPRVKVDANNQHLGTAITRNRALMRASTQMIQNLDADDFLAPNALALLFGMLNSHPDAAFAFGDTADLLPSGATYINDEPNNYLGLVSPGELFEAWQRTGFNALPIHPAGLMWRKQNLLALGGWAAMSGAEDTSIVMAASTLWLSVASNEITLFYRKHPAQTTAQASHTDMKDKHWQFVQDRVSAIKALLVKP